VPLTGRRQQPWSTLVPPRWRAAEARPAPDAAALPAPVPAVPVPGRWRA
jgi:hypothetical protein